MDESDDENQNENQNYNKKDDKDNENNDGGTTAVTTAKQPTPQSAGNDLEKKESNEEIVDDTGLEVDALDGAPGVRSARFAGEDASYADNVTRLLDRLGGVPGPERTARFRTVALLRHPDGREVLVELELSRHGRNRVQVNKQRLARTRELLDMLD